MPTEAKKEQVQEIARLLTESSIAILTEYRGLNVADISAMRRKLREQGIAYHVTKNTLARRAAEDAGKPALVEVLEGPTAIAYGHTEANEVAKALLDYLRAQRSVVKIKGAALGAQVLSPDQVTSLAMLPPKIELFAQILGQLQGGAAQLIGVLNSPMQQLLYILQERAKQLEGGGDQAAPAAE